MPNTHFIEIIARSRPALIPRLDEAGRTLYTINFDTCCVFPTTGFTDCLARLISNAGIGVESVSLFIGIRVGIKEISSAVALMIQVLATGGFSSQEYHAGGKIERSSFQVLVRSTDAAQAETVAISIWGLFDGLRDTSISF